MARIDKDVRLGRASDAEVNEVLEEIGATPLGSSNVGAGAPATVRAPLPREATTPSAPAKDVDGGKDQPTI